MLANFRLISYLCNKERKVVNMEIMVTFCILSGIGLILAALVVATMLAIKGGIGIIGAFCMSFTRGFELLHCTIYGHNSGYTNKGKMTIPIGIFIATYIAIIALISNIW